MSLRVYAPLFGGPPVLADVLSVYPDGDLELIAREAHQTDQGPGFPGAIYSWPEELIDQLEKAPMWPAQAAPARSRVTVWPTDVGVPSSPLRMPPRQRLPVTATPSPRTAPPPVVEARPRSRRPPPPPRPHRAPAPRPAPSPQSLAPVPRAPRRRAPAVREEPVIVAMPTTRERLSSESAALPARPATPAPSRRSSSVSLPLRTLKPVEDQIYRTALKVIDQHIDPGVTLELGLQKQLRDKIKEVCELGCDINTAVSQAVTYYGALIRGDSPSSTERLLGRERIRAGVAPAPVVAPPPRRPAPRPAPEPPPRPSSGGTVVVSPGARYLASYAGIDFSGVAVQSHPGGVVELRTEEGVPAYVPVAAIMSVLPALPEGGMSQAGSSEAARIMRRKAEEEVPF